MSARHPHLTNLDELPWAEGPRHGIRFASKTKRLGTATGGKRLGCSVYELDPGKRAFPMHGHLANEEAIFVLAGEGTLRIDDSESPIRAGDYAAFPAGTTHQMINTSDETLRYLCFSTAEAPDVALYPDSNKLGVLGGEVAPQLRVLYKRADEMSSMAGYWDGEATD